MQEVGWSFLASPAWYACKAWVGLTTPAGVLPSPSGFGPGANPLGEPPLPEGQTSGPDTVSGGCAWGFQTGWVTGPAGAVAGWTLHWLWLRFDHLGSITLGSERWISLKYGVYVFGIVCATLRLLYGLDTPPFCLCRLPRLPPVAVVKRQPEGDTRYDSA